MLTVILLALLQPPTLPPLPTQAVPEEVSELDRARLLHAEGTAAYEAADYPGAIEKFTAALKIVMAEGGTDENTAKQALLYNIAKAHEKAYEMDEDPVHLRQALSLYTRYKESVTAPKDKEDAQAKINALQLRLTKPTPSVVSPKTTTPKPVVPDWKRPRNIGISLMVAGGGAFVGGVVMAVLGSRYESNARDQVRKLDDLGVPEDHPARMQGATFIQQEAKKGKILMGLGGSLAGVGAVLVGTGAGFVVKAKRTRLSARVTTTYVGLTVSGKF